MPNHISVIEEALQGNHEPHTVEELMALPKVARLRIPPKKMKSALYNASRNKTHLWTKLEDGRYVFHNGNGSAAPAPSPEAREAVEALRPARQPQQPAQPRYQLFGTDIGGHDILRAADGELFIAVPVAEHEC